MKAYFVSDIHLKDSQEPSSKCLLGFLIWLESSDATHLFLVGDIFDLWIASHEFFIERFKPIVDQLKKLQALGLQIHYFEGNHDLYLTHFWERELGIKVHARAETFQLGRFRVRVEHGDLINPHDKGYLFLYKLLRTQPLPWLAQSLPSAAVKWIGTRASHASREYTSTSKSLHEDRIRELIREHVRSLWDKPDFLISGHVHVRDDQMVGSTRSINLGAWFDHAECFVLSTTEAKFCRLDADGKPE